MRPRYAARETPGACARLGSCTQLRLRRDDVLVLRDIEGWDPAEVCDALGISDGVSSIPELLASRRGLLRCLGGAVHAVVSTEDFS